MTSKLLHFQKAGAFHLIFPGADFEQRLKMIPEYLDTYEPETGLITITDVIPDGCYRHVVNCLYILSDIERRRLLQKIGVARRMVVETLVLHDTGKIQPHLRIGDRVKPSEAFEDGRLHAARSANMAYQFFQVNPQVETLIRYHHHEEKDLPTAFPKDLLPAYRLVRLVDGLSAAITRRKARVRLFTEETAVITHESSAHPYYNGWHKTDLLSGEICRSQACLLERK